MRHTMPALALAIMLCATAASTQPAQPQLVVPDKIWPASAPKVDYTALQTLPDWRGIWMPVLGGSAGTEPVTKPELPRLKGKYKWQVTGRLIRSGRGYAKQRVAIQARSYGDRTYIEGTRTRRNGVFGWRFKPNSYTWRYVYYGNSITKPAASAAFRTPRKGRSGRVLVQDPQSVIS